MGDTVDIASSNTNVMKSAQASVTFGSGSNTTFFNASMVGAGTASWTATNSDAASDALSVTVAATRISRPMTTLRSTPAAGR